MAKHFALIIVVFGLALALNSVQCQPTAQSIQQVSDIIEASKSMAMRQFNIVTGKLNGK